MRSEPEFHDVPVILLTAKGFELDEEELRQELGIQAVICKPFSPRELLQLVQSLLAVTATGGTTRIADLDTASRDAMRKHLFSAGELLCLNQLAPDQNMLEKQDRHQPDLFGEAK